jgi:phosphomannomutase
MIGLASTDQLYFASGHPPPGCDVHRQPQSRSVQRDRCAARVSRSARTPDCTRSATPSPARSHPRHAARHHLAADVLDAYAAHLLSLAPVAGRRLKVVVDAGNGMAGHRTRGVRPDR